MLEADDDDGVVSTEAPPKSMCGRTFACLDLVLDKTSPPLAPYRLPLVLLDFHTTEHPPPTFLEPTAQLDWCRRWYFEEFRHENHGR